MIAHVVMWFANCCCCTSRRVCIQETKLSSLCNLLANEILGPAFDYDFLPATGAAGGILLAWVRDDWVVSDINKGRFAISARF